MAGPPCGNQEYGAAAAIDARYDDLTFNSSRRLQNTTTTGQLLSPHRADYAELCEFISELLGPDDLNIGYSLQPLISPSLTTLDEILSYGSDRPRPSAPPSSTSMPTHLLQETTICQLRPQVYERSPSRTFFVDPPPPPSKVVQLQCLPAPAHEYSKASTVLSHPWINTGHSLHQPNAKFAFDFAPHPHHNNYPLSDGFDTAVSKAKASSMPSASAMDFHNNQDDYTPNIMAEGPLIPYPENLLRRSPSVQSLEHLSFRALSGPFNSTCLAMSDPASPTSMDSNGAGVFSDSAAMATVLSSPSYSYQTSMLNFEGMSLSAPVSPAQSVNLHMGAALHESFQSVDQDFGSGNYQVIGSISEGDQYKGAWRSAQGAAGIHKRRKYSRRTSRCVPHNSLPNSVCDNIAATPKSTDLQESNLIHQDNGVLIRVKTQDLNLHDGYIWRKYGKKTIKNDTHTRNYMRCEESKRSGCRVLKRTQRCSLDEEYVDFLYLGKHNHHP